VGPALVHGIKPNRGDGDTDSAWKKFFFIDCFGLGEIVGCRSSSSSSDKSNRSDEASSDKLADWSKGHSPWGCKGKYQLKADGEPDGQHSGDAADRHKDKAAAGGLPPSTTGTGGSKPARASGARNRSQSNRRRSQKDRLAAFESPSNKALLQTDPLFHLYLICVGLITLSILAIKCLIPGMPIYTHTVIGFAFLLAIILVSTIYTQVITKKVSWQRAGRKSVFVCCSCCCTGRMAGDDDERASKVERLN
jgi:hypothetical protein